MAGVRERRKGKMDWWTSMNKTDRQLIRYKRIKGATTRFPTIIYFAHDKGNNIDLLFLRGQEKDKRSGVGKKTELDIDFIYQSQRLLKRRKESKKISSFIFLLARAKLKRNWKFIRYSWGHGYTALFSEDRFEFPWQILYNLVWMT